jgi:hypothetical protein
MRPGPLIVNARVYLCAGSNTRDPDSPCGRSVDPAGSRTPDLLNAIDGADVPDRRKVVQPSDFSLRMRAKPGVVEIAALRAALSGCFGA